jgi:hypothetical protein
MAFVQNASLASLGSCHRLIDNMGLVVLVVVVGTLAQTVGGLVDWLCVPKKMRVHCEGLVARFLSSVFFGFYYMLPIHLWKILLVPILHKSAHIFTTGTTASNGEQISQLDKFYPGAV